MEDRQLVADWGVIAEQRIRPIFDHYARPATPWGTAKTWRKLDTVAFMRFAKECGLLVESNGALSLRDVDGVFSQALPRGDRRLDFARFLDALALVAARAFPGRGALDRLRLLVSDHLEPHFRALYPQGGGDGGDGGDSPPAGALSPEEARAAARAAADAALKRAEADVARAGAAARARAQQQQLLPASRGALRRSGGSPHELVALDAAAVTLRAEAEAAARAAQRAEAAAAAARAAIEARVAEAARAVKRAEAGAAAARAAVEARAAEAACAARRADAVAAAARAAATVALAADAAHEEQLQLLKTLQPVAAAQRAASSPQAPSLGAGGSGTRSGGGGEA
jgi:hypothetical protein